MNIMNTMDFDLTADSEFPYIPRHGLLVAPYVIDPEV
jgi:hypothetical protein